MKFSTQRETLLKPLQTVSGVVEKRQTLPILSNVLFKLDPNGLTITATDLEMEVIAGCVVDSLESGAITVPVRKLQDSCKALPEGATVSFEVNNEKAYLKSGKTRFLLATLGADDFPVINSDNPRFKVSVSQTELKKLIEKTSFAMALQDVRYYLNGLLLEITANRIRVVATDGHRLALAQCHVETGLNEVFQAIVPRKAVMELSRLLNSADDHVQMLLGENYIQFQTADVTFTTKLIDGKYPNYDAVIPKSGDNVVYANKDDLKQCLMRTAILSNEKYRGIRLELQNGMLKTKANNPEQEEAEDEIAIDYQGADLTIGFNVNYLTDAISAVDTDQVKIRFTDANGSALVTPTQGDNSLYVVMPMRL
ncbi:MAG: DNA polymerase III subunit beta [Gammaproteobacteria bacterium]|nr:DNA polymerase III subunit beta [Gammaproteobacteria bacterium]